MPKIPDLSAAAVKGRQALAKKATKPKEAAAPPAKSRATKSR